jgi:hypothetical protein
MSVSLGYCNCNTCRSGSCFIRVLSSLPKEKERGNKGRAICRAVGSQVTYATLCGPTAYALRVTLFTTCTRTDTLFKTNYSYKLKISLSPKQVKKSSEIVKKKNRDSYKPSQEPLGSSSIYIKTYKKVLQFKSI